jgi:hypothetical protein
MDVIRPLSYSDGKLIRPETPLTLTEDCLFQCQDAMPLKAFSKNRYSYLLAIWNMSDAEKVSGHFSPSDIDELSGQQWLVYDYFTRQATVSAASDQLPVHLNRMGYQLYHLYPYNEAITPIGLIDKYNCGGTIISQDISPDKAEIELGGSGIFAAYMKEKPLSVEWEGEKITFEYRDKLLLVDVSQGEKIRLKITISN